MTRTTLEVAHAMEATCPPEDQTAGGRLQYEGARRQWGESLVAIAEALVKCGELAEAERLDFYREAGLAIYS